MCVPVVVWWFGDVQQSSQCEHIQRSLPHVIFLQHKNRRDGLDKFFSFLFFLARWRELKVPYEEKKEVGGLGGFFSTGLRRQILHSCLHGQIRIVHALNRDNSVGPKMAFQRWIKTSPKKTSQVRAAAAFSLDIYFISSFTIRLKKLREREREQSHSTYTKIRFNYTRWLLCCVYSHTKNIHIGRDIFYSIGLPVSSCFFFFF